jgi:hypothetical protein
MLLGLFLLQTGIMSWQQLQLCCQYAQSDGQSGTGIHQAAAVFPQSPKQCLLGKQLLRCGCEVLGCTIAIVAVAMIKQPLGPYIVSASLSGLGPIP